MFHVAVFRPWRDSTAEIELRQVAKTLALMAAGTVAAICFSGSLLNAAGVLLGVDVFAAAGVNDILKARRDIAQGRSR